MSSPLPAEEKETYEVVGVETFFDLVYVFAISQLASHLAEHLTWQGAAQTLLLLVAVFTIWSFTTLESTMALARTTSAHWIILSVMVLGLIMNASITGAFEDAPWSFVLPMIAIQIGRSLATRRVDVIPVLRRHRVAMAVWGVVSAIPWCLGAMVEDPDYRWWWWFVAIAIDLIGAIRRHPLPWYPQEGLGDIRFDVPHQVERNRLFLLICLGEAIVRTGDGLVRAPQDTGHLIAAVMSMLALIAVWVLFFGSSKDYADKWFTARGKHTEEQLGRLATYGQQFLVIAFVAYAVGTELAVDEPRRALESAGTALLFGGMALCLVSYALFLVALTGKRDWSELYAGTALTLVLGVVTRLVELPAVWTTTLLGLVMAATAITHDRRPSLDPSSVAS